MGLVVVAGLAGVLIWTSGTKATAKALTFATRRGPLEISVLEGGSLQALESQELKCEVRVGYQGTKILKIVEEGYLITEEDVKTNKVLIELDSSELQKQIVQQEIQYQTALATLIDAQQNYEIQVGQNVSDVKAAEQKVRFARMDFDKFLGDTVTARHHPEGWAGQADGHPQHERCRANRERCGGEGYCGEPAEDRR